MKHNIGNLCIPSGHLTLSFLVLMLLLSSACKKTEFALINGSASSSVIQADGRPNIIVILADDIGYDAISSQGNETFQTPNIDAMAMNGMRFTQCHSSPLCSPSRFAFVSGKYNFRNYSTWGIMDPHEKTFATLLRTAGYCTYVAGKWQFDGGDEAIHSLGYDSYCLWNAINDDPPGSHYKNPKVYQNGIYLPSSKTANKYGDDIFTDSVLSFVHANINRKFFAFFPITLCHHPYCPTPDDPQFKTWETKGNPSDTSYFPSMIKYMDAKIGQIIDSLKKWNLYRNTLLMFVGDNGTPQHIFYYYNGVRTEGGKSMTTESGTHVPFMVTWPAKIRPGQINSNLVDFTDFLPTLADAARISIPAGYGTIDGQSFYPQLTGTSYVPRSWIFCHYQPNTNKGNDILKRWIQDSVYKLYDSTGKFYNIVADPKELQPIGGTEMTPYERQKKIYFQSVMDSLH